MLKFRSTLIHAKETSDVWMSKPDIAACWRGDYRDWHIEDGTNYQNQLFCKFWETFINPSGFSCEICKALVFINWQSPQSAEAFTEMIAAKGKEYASANLVQAVAAKRISEQEALEWVDEYELETTS